MSRQLTKEEIELLNKLKSDTTLEGRGLLRQFILRNTYIPKHKVGDYVKVTDDTHSYIWGCRIRNVNAKITEINWYLREKGKECVQYNCYAIDQFGREHFIVAEESLDGSYQERRIVDVSDTDKNIFEKKSDYSDECGIGL